MIVTMVEARVGADRAEDLLDAFTTAADDLPAAIVESFLLRTADDLWRVVTVWRSRQALDAYRSTVDTPAAIEMFRDAGAEPNVRVFDVASHAVA
jgi:quinol monooxygenase YgiN